jgi:hypothetical protein
VALSAFVDAFNSTSGGVVGATVVRTGYGFQPKACVYFLNGQVGTVDIVGRKSNRVGMGFAVSPTDRVCVCVNADDAAGTMNTDRRHSNSACVAAFSISSTLDGLLDLQSFDAGGQTLVVDDTFSVSYRVHALALGGADLVSAATFQFQAPTATGDQDFTGLAFEPDCVLLTSIGYGTAPTALTTDHILSLGMATSSANQAVCAVFDLNASANSATAHYSRTDECVAILASTTSLTFRASFVSFLPNGFRLNWSEVTTGQPYVLGLALQGGSYRVGSFTMPATLNGTEAVSGLGFAPTALLFLSTGAALEAADTPALERQGSIGVATSATNRGAQGWFSQDAQAASVCASIVEHDNVVALPDAAGGVAALMDLQSLDSDGFTVITDDAPAATTVVHYLAMGSAVAPGAGIVRQMMQHAA